jgi:hypothetical protein
MPPRPGKQIVKVIKSEVPDSLAEAGQLLLKKEERCMLLHISYIQLDSKAILFFS